MICNYDKHEWRMFTRDKQIEYGFKEREVWEIEQIKKGIYVPAVSYIVKTHYKELWYCIKCRFEEERVA